MKEFTKEPQYLLQRNTFVPITIIPSLVITSNSLDLLFFDVRNTLQLSLQREMCNIKPSVESLSLPHKITRWDETYDLSGRYLINERNCVNARLCGTSLLLF